MIEDVHLSTVSNVVDEAPGVGYNVESYVPKGGAIAEATDFSSTLMIDSDNIVSTMQGYSINVPSGAFSNTATLTETNLEADLNGYNGLWKDIIFSDLTINAGMLTAIDGSGCSIDGVTTNSGTKNIFSFDVSYSGCSKSGNYTGVLTLGEQDGVTNLNWMAFDDANQGVFGNVDTQITQDEALSITGELIPSMYVNSSEILITKSNQIFTLEYSFADNASAPFIFEYTYDEDQELIIGNGEGLPTDTTTTNSEISIPVTPSLESVDVTVQYEDLNNIIVTKEYSALDYIHSDNLLDSIAGQWGQLSISESGLVSGSIGDCVAAGQITNKQRRLWDITVTYSGSLCSNPGEYTGVIVGADNNVFGVLSDVIITSLFNSTKTLAVVGILIKQ